MRKLVGWSAALFATFIIVGCGGNTPAPAPEVKAEAKAPPPPPPPPAPEPELSPEAKELKQAMDRRPRPERHGVETVLSANDPEQLVVQLGQAIADKKYQAVWEMLPTPYQEELKTLVGDFANKVDGKLYNRFTTNVQLMVFALRKHKDKFFRHPIVDQLPLDRTTLEKAWDPAVEIGEALLDSELYDIDELRQIDFGRFLGETGSRLADQIPALASAYPMAEIDEAIQFVQSLKNVKASKVSGDDSTQIVKIEVEGKDPIEAEFVKVDGKWIPKVVQENWPTFIQQIKDMIAFLPVEDGTEEGKKKVSRFSGMMNGINFAAILLASVDTDQRFDEYIRVIWEKATGSPLAAPKTDEKKSDEATPPAEEKPAEGTPADVPAEPAPAPDETK